MFKKGEKVVDSGVRTGRYGAHYYDTVDTMCQWAANNTVLTVTTNGSGEHVYAGTLRTSHAYHPSELRYATPAEIAASEAPTLKRGSIVKLKDGAIGFMLRGHKDSEGEYVATFLDSRRVNYFKPEDIEVVLGSIETDGSFLPTLDDADPDPCPTWRNLNVGDIIRVDTDNPRHKAWMGNRVIVTDIDEDDPHQRLCVKDKSNSSAWVRGDAGDFEIIERTRL